jgi:hypothetical protein
MVKYSGKVSLKSGSNTKSSGYIGKGCKGFTKSKSGTNKQCVRKLYGYQIKRGRKGTSHRRDYCEIHFKKYRPKNWENDPLWTVIKNNEKKTISSCASTACYSIAKNEHENYYYCDKHIRKFR